MRKLIKYIKDELRREKYGKGKKTGKFRREGKENCFR